MNKPKRISLAEVSRATGAMLAGGDLEEWDEKAPPTLRDLTECLHFSPGDGRIWMNNRRMVLLYNAAFGSLRRELIDTLGAERARGILMRTGYVSGVRDAELVREQWPNSEPIQLLAAGTRLHALEGVVKVEALSIHYDPKANSYSGEFLWHNSSEADEHLASYGLATEPVCWMQVGHAIGYVTTLVGKLIIFRETECRAMGFPVCRLVGKPAEEWDDVESDLRHLNVEEFVSAGSYPQPEATQRAELPTALPEDDTRPNMIGMAPAFAAACHRLQRVAPTRATVLFVGESGVGKELFARMLHDIGPVPKAPFVSVNCAAIPDTLVESELFGVERGAFTSATQSREGRFERANGGTLFLDEISSLTMVAQGKLLRALQEGEIERVGGTRTIQVDVRVVAASNVDLRDEVKAGRFREDLYFRLNVFPIHLPSLRDRRDDIPLLLNYFLSRYNQRHGRAVAGFTTRAVRALLNYSFPGNIRELQNLIERGVIAADDGALIDIGHLFISGESAEQQLLSISDTGGLASEIAAVAKEEEPDVFRALARIVGQKDTDHLSLDGVERTLMTLAVQQSNGNLSAAARLLGLTRPQLAYRLKKIGIE
ncbi:MAG: sigma-54-dependent Fis family transcriptional regulator [Rhodocyclales bacterium]|nr:sigma-54-dependent Fis family transcriptional regulator [Rhodocyclales bacterium]